ncbi:hypothetical protein PIB30_045854 [Stylosanthes scabra]|uniref:Homeobox-leucine zipper protein n=1 Tax=Stylosanthes scabra TaxID=79078 RepID=A0ABU6XDZ6_9FABA|nr:hypothetical protein [Stylosanthes scabra]
MLEATPSSSSMEKMNHGGSSSSNLEKKKRLTNEQLDSLERSFQKEIKLDPDRKMKLSKELGLQPRQIAVWFQNRRARWKAKQLEHLYDSLKQEYDVISKEKQKLQEEVMKLKGILRDQQGCGRTTQISNYTNTEISGGGGGGDETTVESTSEALRCSNKKSSSISRAASIVHHHNHNNNVTDNNGNCSFTVDDYNSTVPVPVPVLPYWPAVPNYYP